MKIVILGGFLGSGKTSLLLKLARHVVGDDPGHGSKVVVIENEIGEVGVDDVVLRSGGLQVENMFAGCVCCTLAGQLVPTLAQLEKEYSPELVILEATGVACPDSIATMITRSLPEADVRICTIVDAKRWPRLSKALGHLIESQLMGASVVLVSKTDLVSPEEADAVVASVREMNPDPAVHKVSAPPTSEERASGDAANCNRSGEDASMAAIWNEVLGA